MRAAKGAGLFSFGILTGLTAADMTSAGADITIPDFQSDVLWDVLRKRLPTAI